MSIRPPRGLIVNLVTPLDREGGVDAMALTWLIRKVQKEADAILAGSIKIGEALFLRVKDRLAILEASLRGIDKGKPLIFEITTKSKKSTVSLLDRTEAVLKAHPGRGSFFYLLTPLVCQGNRDLPGFIKDLTARTRNPLILSNNPELVKTLTRPVRHKNIRTHVLKEICLNEQVAGLEYHGDSARAVNFQRALKSRAGFRFYDGSEKRFMDRPASSGLISCGANLLPQAWADLVNSSLDIFESRRMRHEYLSRIWSGSLAVKGLMEIYRKNETAYIKKALELKGDIPSGWVAAKGARLKPEEEDKLKVALERYEIIK